MKRVLTNKVLSTLMAEFEAIMNSPSFILELLSDGNSLNLIPTSNMLTMKS